MALQSSGSISLNDIHVEAGGSSGSNCTINDSDIRGLISKASQATMSFNEWYGASSVVTQEEDYDSNYAYGYTSFLGNESSFIEWNGSEVVNNSNKAYDFDDYVSNYSYTASNTPFPAHSGTIGGWRYFVRRNLQSASYFYDEFNYGQFWDPSRTTSSSYPY